MGGAQADRMSRNPQIQASHPDRPVSPPKKSFIVFTVRLLCGREFAGNQPIDTLTLFLIRENKKQKDRTSEKR
jgi:hypothetical protein